MSAAATITAVAVKTVSIRIRIKWGTYPHTPLFHHMEHAIHHLRRNDPVLAKIIGRVGEYRMQFREPTFESLARAIVYQQLSGKVAAVIYGRFSALKGQVLPEE